MTRLLATAALAVLAPAALLAQDETAAIPRDEGLDAWGRIHAVLSHPRCANCHTDEANLPMWSGPEFDRARPHGMNIDAGESRIGAETLPCATCHALSTLPNDVPHAAPHAGIAWQLAPVAFVWFNVSEAEICVQLRDPERNGGRDAEGLVGHITHDIELSGFIAWGFDPGAGREPAPGGIEAHLADMRTWTGAGMPCPGDD